MHQWTVAPRGVLDPATVLMAIIALYAKWVDTVT